MTYVTCVMTRVTYVMTYRLASDHTSGILFFGGMYHEEDFMSVAIVDDFIYYRYT